MDNLIETSSIKGLGIKGKILWSGSIETIVITSDDLKKLGWTNKMINDFMEINHEEQI